jgi:hypothetical protein
LEQKIWLGYVLGDFFTSSSGHPVIFSALGGTCSSVQQGDQIGRIFAYWAFVYFGQFFSLQKELKFLGNLFPQYKKVMHQF